MPRAIRVVYCILELHLQMLLEVALTIAFLLSGTVTKLEVASFPMDNLFESTDETFLPQFPEQLAGTELIANPTYAENQFQSFADENFQVPNTEEMVANGLTEAPIYVENQALVPGGAALQIQEQDFAAAGYYNSFSQALNENVPMYQGLNVSNAYTTSSLEPNTMGNNTLSGINHQSSSHSSQNQIYLAEERSRIDDMRVPNNQIMTGERSTLSSLQNNQIVNSHNALNYIWSGQSMGMQIAPSNAASSSIMASSSNSILNDYSVTPMINSAGPSNAVFLQQNQRPNLQIGQINSSPLGQSANASSTFQYNALGNARMQNLGNNMGTNAAIAFQQLHNAIGNARMQNLGNNRGTNLNLYRVQNQHTRNAYYDRLRESFGHPVVDPLIRLFLESTEAMTSARWLIGDGRCVNFWIDYSYGDDHVIDMLNVPVEVHTKLIAKLNSLHVQNNWWVPKTVLSKAPHLHEQFHHISLSPFHEDQPVWKEAQNTK
ncbi:hypothetical protein Fmac_031605 [Flemingia macrophylla]|uniref:Uncharacterized protein n=1 Tax=Flemingia macrophylla TaxID=520843 RepID=A0ABD1L2I5_9FABA